MQDIISWLGGKGKKRRYRFGYSPEKKILRYGFLILFLATLIGGVGSVAALLAPYSAYGRIAQNLLAPCPHRAQNKTASGIASNMLCAPALVPNLISFHATKLFPKPSLLWHLPQKLVPKSNLVINWWNKIAKLKAIL